MVVGGCGSIAGSMSGSLVYGSCWDVLGSRNLNGVVVLVISRGSRDRVVAIAWDLQINLMVSALCTRICNSWRVLFLKANYP